MAAIMFATFLLLCRMLKSCVPRESLLEWTGRLAVFFAGLGLLSQLAFDRLDAVMGALLLLAVALMLGRRHYAWSFLVLAVAIAFKFVPIVLAPLWVIGSLPVEMIAARNAPGGMRRLFFAMTGRGMLLGAFTSFSTSHSCSSAAVKVWNFFPTTVSAALNSAPPMRRSWGF